MRYWYISFRKRRQHPNKSHVRVAVFETVDKDIALDLFLEHHRDCEILGVKPDEAILTCYNDLVEWLRENNISPEEARTKIRMTDVCQTCL